MYNRQDVQLEKSTVMALIGLGFPTEIKGYEYLRCAVIEAYYCPELTAYVTKTLFPRVARLCGCVPVSSVSRGCRRAIEYASNNGRLGEFLASKNDGAYPSSALVVSEIARYLHSSLQQ